jgi:hypothetical protein
MLTHAQLQAIDLYGDEKLIKGVADSLWMRWGFNPYVVTPWPFRLSTQTTTGEAFAFAFATLSVLGNASSRLYSHSVIADIVGSLSSKRTAYLFNAPR